MSDPRYLLDLLNYDEKSITNLFIDYINSINSSIFTFAKLLIKKNLIKEQQLLKNTLLPLTSQIKQYTNEINAVYTFDSLTQLGDLHNQGRCTVLAKNREQKIIYKPIPTDMLSFINEAFKLLSSLNIKTIRFIEKQKDYAIIEYIPPESCLDLNQYAFYYGAMLFMIALLRGIDFHHENFLCVSSTPVVIDCESLLYPVVAETKKYTLEASLLIPTTSNQQSVINKMVLPTQDILNGVKEACLSLTTKVDEVKTLIIKYSKKKNRMIFKPTRFYAAIIKNSTHPNFLLDKNKRKNYILNCLKGSHTISKTIATSEFDELINFNIPYFYKSEKNLYGCDDSIIEQNFITDSTNLIFDSLKNLDTFQLELINQIKHNILKFSNH